MWIYWQIANSPTMDVIGSLSGKRNKPGKLGEFKGTDALRRENKVVGDVAKKLKLTPAEKRKLHDDVSGEGLDYQKILQRALEKFGKS